LAVNAFGVCRAPGTCLIAANVERVNSVPPNPLARFEGPNRDGGKERKRKERREGKGQK